MSDVMNEQSPGRISKIAIFIIISTFLLEMLGVLGLYGLWQDNGWYKSLFHSISAFCNAGFSLQADSLTAYSGSWRIAMVICPLIILGGLGFPVLNNLWELLVDRVKRRWRPYDYRHQRIKRLSLHSKLALTATAILLVVGFSIMLVLELTRSDRQAGICGMDFLTAMFNSVTARTAGFNTVDIASLSTGSKLTLILLMSIGGSPSSTAGGIKTVTLAVMVLAIYTTMRRRDHVQAFKRTIPTMVVRRAATLIMMYGMLLWTLTLLLTITEHSNGTNMLDMMFETSSALGTVGLSTGVTAGLSEAGKWVIIVAMFVGRLGPLSLLASLSFNTQTNRYEYPYEPLVVG